MPRHPPDPHTRPEATAALTLAHRQVEEEYEAALAARRAEMEAELLRKDLEQLNMLGEVSDPTTSSVPSVAAEEPLADSAAQLVWGSEHRAGDTAVLALTARRQVL